MTKTRPAPLGATYKRNVRPSWLRSRPDVAPSGARSVSFDPSYKDLAPPELGRCIAKRADSGSTGNHLLERVEQGQSRKTVTNLTGQTFVNSVSLADVASRVYHITGVNGAKSALW
jgi:hypothetical protein